MMLPCKVFHPHDLPEVWQEETAWIWSCPLLSIITAASSPEGRETESRGRQDARFLRYQSLRDVIPLPLALDKGRTTGCRRGLRSSWCHSPTSHPGSARPGF